MATDEEIEEARRQALGAILEDTSTHKVVVAGPGTGKTYTYRELLTRTDGPALAITFLTVLVEDLARDIGDRAHVRSFHAFCKGLLHENDVEGLTRRFQYFPPLNRIVERDISVTDDRTSWRDIENALMNLDEESYVVQGVLRSGDYYNAVGHTDAVYRVLRHLRFEHAAVPRYQQIVVDEYQDFSLLEVRLIDELARYSPTLIVGDDDQALYGFKHASAVYLRELVNNSSYERFELPYCSRCTEVLVDATNHVVAVARERGLLEGRIDKPYLCFMPSKRADSERYPRIVHANCTMETNPSPIMCRYVEWRLRDVPHEDVEASREAGHPTVLIIGPTQFTQRVYRHLEEVGLPNLRFKASQDITIEPIDGYRLLASDRKSRLGWRILLHCHAPRGWQDWMRRALIDGDELFDVIDASYRDSQLEIAALIERIGRGETLRSEESSRAEAATGMGLDALKAAVGMASLDDESSDDAERAVPAELEDPSRPTVLVTSLLGAKGLQAEHVFVVGLNDGHFPRSNRQPTDDEVCQLIVALTRARKSCTLVSCARFGFDRLEESLFVEWLMEYVERHDVNAASVR